MAVVRITEFTDPGCPWAYSAEPFRRRLDWLYGEDLVWEVRMVGLAGSPEEYEAKGFDTARMAAAYRRIAHEHGMPIDTRERPRMAATVPACRAVVAARRESPERMRPLLRRLPTLAWGMPVCALLLASIGLTVVRSASTELAVDYLPRQAAWVGVGVVALLLGFAIGHGTLLRFAVPLYGIGIVALALTLSFGHEAGGARSWIGIGGLGGQPSDLMKLATILLLVRYLGASDHDFLSARELVVVAALVALPALLIALEPDLGGALILLPALGALVWLAGLRLRVVAGRWWRCWRWAPPAGRSRSRTISATAS